jgi:hypothetical protein
MELDISHSDENVYTFRAFEDHVVRKMFGLKERDNETNYEDELQQFVHCWNV